jgi:hypothetical protein
LTQNAAEIHGLDTGVFKGWARTGLAIQTVDGTTGAEFASGLPLLR